MKTNFLIQEGFKDDKTPDLKYYAFDWDDNIVHMPTKIIVKDEDGKEIGMSTDDFADHRHNIGKKDFNYNGHNIVGFADNPFRNFRTEGDKDFLIDAMRAKTGPSFDDFREAINNGSIFSIITARGHNPNTLKTAIYNYIISDFKGISKDELVKNLKKYRDFAGEDKMSDNELIKYYLSLNKYYPVSFGSGSASNPEEGKVRAMDEFVEYIQNMAAILNKRVYLKNDLGNEFISYSPSIGFSDDDPKNVDAMKKHLENKIKNIVKTYSTAGGIKKQVENYKKF
jgi:hypothetical protein